MSKILPHSEINLGELKRDLKEFNRKFRLIERVKDKKC